MLLIKIKTVTWMAQFGYKNEKPKIRVMFKKLLESEI